MGTVTTIPDSVSDAGQGHNYTGKAPYNVTLVTTKMTPDGANRPLNRSVVDAFIAGEVAAGRAYTTAVANWNPTGPLDLARGLPDASRYNYARVETPVRVFYVFADYEYLNLKVTRFNTTVDEWTTYDAGIASGFVVQSHVGVAASQNDITGENYCLEPEPVSVGEFDVLATDIWNVFGGGEPNVVVISTTNLANEVVFRDNPIADEPYTRINMGVKTAGLSQHIDDLPPIWARAVGTVPGSTSAVWPFPNTDASYAVGPELTSSQVEPMNLPWVNSARQQIMVPRMPSTTPSSINGVPQPGGVFVYANMRSYLFHMSILAHVPWVVAGISDVYLIPNGMYGATGRATTSGAESLNPQGYLWTQNIVSNNTDLALYKENVNYATTASVNLRNDWRSLFNAGIYKKLNTSQFSRIRLTNRDGSIIEFAPERFKASNAGISMERTHLSHSELGVWSSGVPGASEEPMRLGFSVSLPVFQVGRDLALSSGAIGMAAHRGMSVWRYDTAISSAAYSRYASQAQDGFNTVINKVVGGAMSGGLVGL